jgi:hypothetical protein
VVRRVQLGHPPARRAEHADIFDQPEINLGRFDTAISNPPFGNTSRTGAAPG